MGSPSFGFLFLRALLLFPPTLHFSLIGVVLVDQLDELLQGAHVRKRLLSYIGAEHICHRSHGDVDDLIPRATAHLLDNPNSFQTTDKPPDGDTDLLAIQILQPDPYHPQRFVLPLPKDVQFFARSPGFMVTRVSPVLLYRPRCFTCSVAQFEQRASGLLRADPPPSLFLLRKPTLFQPQGGIDRA